MKTISTDHVSFPVVYFFSLEYFGCCVKAHNASKSETIPLKREILDVPPTSLPPPCIYSTSLIFFLFCFTSFISLCSSTVVDVFFIPEKRFRCPFSPSFLHSNIHPNPPQSYFSTSIPLGAPFFLSFLLCFYPSPAT